MFSGRGIRLKGLKRYSSGGVEYVYHRKSGRRLPDLLANDPKFLAAYLEAENQPELPKKNGVESLEAVATSFLRSATNKAFSASYRDIMRNGCAKLVNKAGHVPFRTIQRKHIVKDLSALKPNPANSRLKVWRNLCKHAKTYLRDDNPSDGLKKQPSPMIKGHTPWDSSDIKIFRDHFPFGTRERLAFELIYWSGARMSDAVRLGEGNVCKDGWLNFKQVKTGGEVYIPFRRSVPKIADIEDLKQLHQAILAAPERHITFMTTAYGSSRSQKSASTWFSKATRATGIIGKSAHGLRKSRASALAERGATTHQIGAWTGHDSLAEIEHYSKAANKKRMLSGTDTEQKVSRLVDP